MGCKVGRKLVTSQDIESIIAGTGGVAAKSFTNLSMGQEQSVKTMTTSRFTGQLVPHSGKLINYTYRVSFSCVINILYNCLVS